MREIEGREGERERERAKEKERERPRNTCANTWCLSEANVKYFKELEKITSSSSSPKPFCVNKKERQIIKKESKRRR